MPASSCILIHKIREKAADISQLQRQVKFPLVTRSWQGENVIVSHYVADYVYQDRDGQQHVVDAKGKRTAMYQLKAKWLFFQDGITVEEV